MASELIFEFVITGTDVYTGRRRRKRPRCSPSPNHDVTQQYLGDSALVRQQRASIAQTKAVGHLRSAEVLAAKRPRKVVLQESLALTEAPKEVKSFFGSTSANVSPISLFPENAQNSLPLLQRQFLVPLGTTHPTKHSLEPIEYISPEHRIKTINTPRSSGNSLGSSALHALSSPPLSDPLMAEEQASHTDLTLADYSTHNLPRQPSLKSSKDKPSITYPKSNSPELEDAEGDTQSDEDSVDSNTDIDGDSGSDASSESHLRQYPSASSSIHKKYQQEKEGREYEWMKWYTKSISSLNQAEMF